MADAKHTPGPWRNGKDSNGQLLMFQRASESADPNPEWQANLRLLDAAPELLEALIALEAAASWQETEDISAYDNAVNAARTAIAKATGVAS